MKKIITTDEALKLSEELKNKNKRIVLVGGCFDILHKGHVAFLSAAREQGDTLFVLVESDEQIRKLKGHTRPVNTEQMRINVLASLDSVDYILLLSPHMKNEDYDKVILGIKPAIIATTRGDNAINHKIRQADLVGGKVVEVIERIPDQSTTTLLSKITL